MSSTLADLIQSAADALFMPWVVGILLLSGLFLTFRTGFVQVRRFGEACRVAFVRRGSGADGALTPFQAFMTALGASIGTGNIAGVATAIVSGGPGALFWIWVYGFVATAIKFSEAVLGMTFREARGEQVLSGPMYYLRDGLRSPFLAWTFAFVAAVAALTTTPFTQPNSMALVLNSVFGIPRIAAGVAIAVLTWLVIIGGIKSIGRVAESLSPLKVGLYLVGGLIVILVNAARIPEILSLVVSEALTTRSALGFGMFVAMRYGIARGIYANEAGYGTAAVAYGTARSTQPALQGLNAVMETFIVSFVTSSISALTILLTGAWQSGLTSTAAVAAGFNLVMPFVGGWIVAFCTFLFGYTTLIGWAYYGEQFFEYILGRKVTVPYRWIYCLLIPFGAVSRVEVVWAWGDLMNVLQVFPNLIGVLGLSGIVAKAAWQKLKSLTADCGIRHAKENRHALHTTRARETCTRGCPRRPPASGIVGLGLSGQARLEGAGRDDWHERPLQLRRPDDARRSDHPELRAAWRQRRRAAHAAGRGVSRRARAARCRRSGRRTCGRCAANTRTGGRSKGQRRRVAQVAAVRADGEGPVSCGSCSTMRACSWRS